MISRLMKIIRYPDLHSLAKTFVNRYVFSRQIIIKLKLKFRDSTTTQKRHLFIFNSESTLILVLIA